MESSNLYNNYNERNGYWIENGYDYTVWKGYYKNDRKIGIWNNYDDSSGVLLRRTMWGEWLFEYEINHHFGSGRVFYYNRNKDLIHNEETII